MNSARLEYENRHDLDRARNIWELAARRWKETEAHLPKPNFAAFHDIAEDLGNLEREAGRYAEAVNWFEEAKPHAPNPDAVQKQIDDLRAKVQGPPSHG